MKINTTPFFHQACRNLFLMGVFLYPGVNVLQAQEFLSNIEKAIKHGNASKLEAYFDHHIDVAFAEKTVTYTRKQAGAVIREFFTKVEPKDFTQVNKGTSHANNTIYYIGTLGTGNGPYKVYMFFVIRNATYVMKELRFEKG